MSQRSPQLLSETTGYQRRMPPHGQMAILLAGVVIGVILMGIQLWLLTIALDLYLGGRGNEIWGIVLISGLVFLGGLLSLRMLGRQPEV